MNSHKLALLTEWNFAQGKIRSYDDLIHWSIYLAQLLQGDAIDSPQGRKAVVRGAAEILRDLHPMWKKLSYGGRTHQDVSEQRKIFLEETIQSLAS